MANNYYSQKKYGKAVQYYELLKDNNFENEKLQKYYFNLGYSYFKIKEFVKAENTFFELKDVEGEYTVPSKYYFGHCAYMNKNYET